LALAWEIQEAIRITDAEMVLAADGKIVAFARFTRHSAADGAARESPRW